MRLVLVTAVVGTALSVSLVQAQNASGQKSLKKQHPSSAMDGLFENGPERPHALVDVGRESAERKAKAEKSADASAAAETPAAPPAPVIPSVQAVPPGPPQKNLSGEEFRLIRVGSAEKEVLAVLGPPSSRVVVPDDDGHLRESLQYWVKGSPMGTVRLDNGHVIQIETQAK